MAVVKTETISIGSVPFKKVFNCDKNGKFWMNLPDCVVEKLALDKKRISAETLFKLDALFKANLEYAKATASAVRKVIVFELEGNAKAFCDDDGMIVPESDNDDDNVRNEIGADLFMSEHFRGRGFSFTIQVGVFLETTVSLNGADRMKYDRMESSIPFYAYPHEASSRFKFDAVVIDWTEEREASALRALQRMLDIAREVASVDCDQTFDEFLEWFNDERDQRWTASEKKLLG